MIYELLIKERKKDFVLTPIKSLEGDILLIEQGCITYDYKNLFYFTERALENYWKVLNHSKIHSKEKSRAKVLFTYFPSDIQEKKGDHIILKREGNSINTKNLAQVLANIFHHPHFKNNNDLIFPFYEFDNTIKGSYICNPNEIYKR